MFDAGIGSYDIAKKVSLAYPAQDVIYFADRASFPYGTKSHDELTGCIMQALRYFENFDPALIILASNAPSIMILDEIQREFPIPIIGVLPPISAALSLTKTGEVGVLGVNALIRSPEMRAYASLFEATSSTVHLIQVSHLVEFVESGKFLTDPDATLAAVQQQMSDISEEIDVLTLSLTHLPWLRSAFSNCVPKRTYIDPADQIVAQVAPYVREGAGRLQMVASQSAEHSLSDFRSMLKRLGVEGTVMEKSAFLKLTSRTCPDRGSGARG